MTEMNIDFFETAILIILLIYFRGWLENKFGFTPDIFLSLFAVKTTYIWISAFLKQNLPCADNDFSFNSPCNDLFFMLTLCLGKIWSPPLVRRREVVWTASSSCAGRKLDILRYPSHRNRTGRNMRPGPV